MNKYNIVFFNPETYIIFSVQEEAKTDYRAKEQAIKKLKAKELPHYIKSQSVNKLPVIYSIEML